jgi:hypothetical protein
MEAKGICIRYVDRSIKPNEAVSTLGPLQGCRAIGIVEVFFGDEVARDCCEDVLVKFLDIHKNDTMHDRMYKVSSTNRCS